MGWKSLLLKPYAKKIHNQILRQKHDALADQEAILSRLVDTGRRTHFGKDHNFNRIRSYEDFKTFVPVRDYEALRPYFDRVVAGESDVVWPGKPKYLAKTSGTTSGVKYIPISHDSIVGHIQSARDAILNYAFTHNSMDLFEGKIIFLSGSPVMEPKNGMLVGRLSGISNHEIPFWLKGHQVPSYETNCIDDWEKKVERIVEETFKSDLRIIGGIPPWVQMFYEKLLEFTGKKYVKEVFPNFRLFVYGGVNYEPYRAALEELVGESIPSVELFPASEGFVAYQDSFPSEGLLLNTKKGMYFEFIPLSKFAEQAPPRLNLEQVECGVDYVMVISSNAGLWGYNLGDTVSFSSLNPYRIVVTGRVKHYISAFGEHVIGKEVERALKKAMDLYNCEVTEFTVAPRLVQLRGELPYHEWFIEWERQPSDLIGFAKALNQAMCQQNIYYRDLIEGQVLQALQISNVRRNGFREYMLSTGKLGGQNKVPRLSNDRKIADKLMLS